MTKFGPLARLVALAGLAVFASYAAAPALAGPADVALLKSYEGNWKGKGSVVGTDTETVICKLSLSEGNGDKVNYNGRCALAGANLSIAGTLAYVDENKRFEAAMTSNATFSGVAIGQRQGAGLVFNLRTKDTTKEGDLTIIAAITLTANQISVSFKATDDKTGKFTSAVIPFTKS